VLSAFARLQREGKIDQAEITKVVKIFQYDWEMQYQSVEVDQRVVEVAGQLVQKHPLRAYDSIQLAASLIVAPFFSVIDSKMFVFV
jgi:predicted nucleic acid-binding protein